VFSSWYNTPSKYLAAAVALLALVSVCLGAVSRENSSQTQPQQSPNGVSDQKPASTPFDKDLLRASFLAESGKANQATEVLREVLAKAAEAGDLYNEARARRELGAISFNQANYPEARAEFELALSLFQSIHQPRGEAEAANRLGSVYFKMGDNSTAQQCYRRSIEAYDRLGLQREKGFGMYNLAMVDEPDRDRLCQEALDIGRRIGDKNLQARVLHFQGDSLFKHGEFDAAQEKLEQAASLYQQTGDQADMARVMTSEGVLQRAHGHPDKSLDLYKKALEVQERVGDRQGAIQSINAMAVAHDHLGEYSQAVQLYEQALSMAKETGSPLLVNFQLGNLAGCYIQIGKDKEAAGILEELLRQGLDPWPKPYRYLSLSIARFHLGQFPESLDDAGKSVEASRTLNQTDPLPGALYQKAQAEAKLGYAEAALADADDCLQTIEALRKHLVPSDFMKRGFASTTQNVFGFLIGLLLRNDQAGRALEVAEQARSRAFLDLLASRDVQSSPARQEQLASLRKVHQELLAQGIDPSTNKTKPTFAGVIRGGNSGVPDLWNVWMGGDAELRSTVSAEPVSYAELQSAARRLNATVLSYWVSEQATYVWAVAPAGAVHSARVDISSKRLAELVSGLWPGRPGSKRGQGPELDSQFETDVVRGQVRTRGGSIVAPGQTGRKNWRELYRLLIEPVERWLPRAPGSLLTIEPHGPLTTLPFAALRDARGRYLIERFTLHFVPAVSLLRFTANKRRARIGSPSYLLIADPAGTPRGEGDRPLPALAGARREVSTVAHLLPSSQVKLLEGSDATEGRVDELAGHSSVIHFATHGIIRDDRPFDSFLALGGAGWDLSHDGHFTAQKIYGMDLHADLVFLSACRSGLGQVSGDGVPGLTRAFLYAGTPSVIATLWDVADEPTYRLVGAFYRSWLRGSDKARALRLAQLRLLGQLRRGQVKVHTTAGGFSLPEDPVFWASFALQGEP
jgi:CHAT domain-containing protein/tetratricopeptide (TPR) repeat protein